jgi:hypothetical protein
LIDPDSSEFKGSATSKKVLRLYLETMDKIRYPNEQTEESIQRRKDTGEYYQVPLTEAVFSRQVKGLGLKKAIINKVEQYKELTEGVFAGGTEEKEEFEKTHNKLFNKFLQLPQTTIYCKDRMFASELKIFLFNSTAK